MGLSLHSNKYFNTSAFAKPTSVMIRLFVLTFASVITILSSSCGCCTSDSEAPLLRPLPTFQEIEAAPSGKHVHIELTK